jgi:hypothetical protein
VAVAVESSQLVIRLEFRILREQAPVRLRREFREAFCKSIEYRELRICSGLAQFYLKPYLLLAYGKIYHQIRVRAL